MTVDPPTHIRLASGLPKGPFEVVSTWSHRAPGVIGVWLRQPPEDRVWPITKTTADEVLSWEVECS